MTDQGAWATARADMYRFLAATFLEPPNQRLLAPLLAVGFLSHLEEFFGPAVLGDLRQFVQEFQGDYETLDREFQSLFMVPLGRYVAPYESVYRDERELGDTRVRGLLMGPSTLAVKQAYREAGLVISEDFRDLPDHIGLELACMEFLCRAEAEAWAREDLEEISRMRDLQRRLLQDHLLQWVPALSARIRDHAPGPLYRGFAHLMEAYLFQDAIAQAVPSLAG